MSSSVNFNDPDLYMTPQQWKMAIGLSVCVEGYGKGNLEYYGPYERNGEDVLGIILRDPKGYSDGTTKYGDKVFHCSKEHGIFVDETKVLLLDQWNAAMDKISASRTKAKKSAGGGKKSHTSFHRADEAGTSLRKTRPTGTATSSPKSSPATIRKSRPAVTAVPSTRKITRPMQSSAPTLVQGAQAKGKKATVTSKNSPSLAKKGTTGTKKAPSVTKTATAATKKSPSVGTKATVIVRKSPKAERKALSSAKTGQGRSDKPRLVRRSSAKKSTSSPSPTGDLCDVKVEHRPHPFLDPEGISRMQLRRQSSGDVSGDERARQSGSPTRSCASPNHRTIVPRQHTHKGVSESHTRLRRQRSLDGSQPDVGVMGGPRRSLRRKSKSSGHLAPMEPASAQGVPLGTSVSPPPTDVVRAHPFLAQHGSSKTQARKLAGSHKPVVMPHRACRPGYPIRARLEKRIIDAGTCLMACAHHTSVLWNMWRQSTGHTVSPCVCLCLGVLRVFVCVCYGCAGVGVCMRWMQKPRSEPPAGTHDILAVDTPKPTATSVPPRSSVSRGNSSDELHASAGVAQARLRLQRSSAQAKEQQTSFVRSASNEGPLPITTYDDIPVKKSGSGGDMGLSSGGTKKKKNYVAAWRTRDPVKERREREQAALAERLAIEAEVRAMDEAELVSHIINEATHTGELSIQELEAKWAREDRERRERREADLRARAESAVQDALRLEHARHERDLVLSIGSGAVGTTQSDDGNGDDTATLAHDAQ
eukprot:m.1359840 g.1359840  ORF g.1359840 m.1359840 type:complete len:760 (+) comp24939_c0_seq19:392-2671(+)